VAATCRRGERALYFAFEESESQIVRNMRSIGLELGPHIKKGLLHVYASRPTSQSLEMHLVNIQKMIDRFKPSAVAFDPVTNLIAVGTTNEVRAMLTRLIDYLKAHYITAMFTSLTAGGADPDQTEVGISSLMDTWLLVRNLESHGERNRGLYVLKSRGMAHSNQVREFVLSDKGIDLLDVYLGAGGFLTGSARVAQQAREEAERLNQRQVAARQKRDSIRKRKALEAQINALKAELAAHAEEAGQSESAVNQVEKALAQAQTKLTISRGGAPMPRGNGERNR
jgi:circadian clock protein KaiC